MMNGFLSLDISWNFSFQTHTHLHKTLNIFILFWSQKHPNAFSDWKVKEWMSWLPFPSKISCFCVQHKRPTISFLILSPIGYFPHFSLLLSCSSWPFFGSWKENYSWKKLSRPLAVESIVQNLSGSQYSNQLDCIYLIADIYFSMKL